MAEIASYTWQSFNEEDAKIGLRVGFQQTEESDLSQTGILQTDNRYTTYKTVIDGKTLYINNLGVVIKVIPADDSLVNTSVQIVTCEMKTTYGNQQGITRGVSEDSETVATLSSMEPRDQFALYAMQAIMRSLDAPADMDDANILFNCRAAYRWAQGMMIASADARAEKKKATDTGGEGGSDSEEGGEESGTTRSAVDTSGGTDTEKLLGNLVEAVDDLTKQMKANNEALLKATLKIDIASASTFFTQYKDEMATALADKFDAKGAASQALTEAKAYTDSKVNS